MPPIWVLTAPELEGRQNLEGEESKYEIPGTQAQVGKDIVETRHSETP